MQKTWDVVVLGGANMDYLIRGTNLPQPGETLDGEEFMVACGGKGANQAVAAARLGARVAFVGRVGKDASGRDIVRNLKRERVDARSVQYDPRLPTGAALIMVDADAEKLIFVAPGANHRLAVAPAKRILQSTRVLVLQFEVPMPAVLAAAKIAHAAGAKVVLDPAPAASPPKDLLPLVDFVRPNAAEAETLSGTAIRNLSDARRAARKLCATGVTAAAIDVPGKGNLLVWPGGERLLPRIKVRSVDATGAGDAFVGAFSVALAEGRSWSAAGEFANAAAAFATTKFGAQSALPNRKQVLRLLRKTA